MGDSASNVRTKIGINEYGVAAVAEIGDTTIDELGARERSDPPNKATNGNRGTKAHERYAHPSKHHHRSATNSDRRLSYLFSFWIYFFFEPLQFILRNKFTTYSTNKISLT